MARLLQRHDASTIGPLRTIAFVIAVLLSGMVFAPTLWARGFGGGGSFAGHFGGAMGGARSGVTGMHGPSGSMGLRSGGPAGTAPGPRFGVGPGDFRARFGGRSGDFGSGPRSRFGGRSGDFRSGARSGFSRGGFDRFHRHHFGGHSAFFFFFDPLFLHGYAFPYYYYDPYYEYFDPDYGYAYPYQEYEGPEGEPSPESSFEPYYGDWTWSAKDGYYICHYHITPRASLLVISYADDEDLAYFYDPAAGEWVGVLDHSNGEFRHWYRDEHEWSDPEPFPFAPPPPLNAGGARKRGS